MPYQHADELPGEAADEVPAVWSEFAKVCAEDPSQTIAQHYGSTVPVAVEPSESSEPLETDLATAAGISWLSEHRETEAACAARIQGSFLRERPPARDERLTPEVPAGPTHLLSSNFPERAFFVDWLHCRAWDEQSAIGQASWIPWCDRVRPPSVGDDLYSLAAGTNITPQSLALQMEGWTPNHLLEVTTQFEGGQLGLQLSGLGQVSAPDLWSVSNG